MDIFKFILLISVCCIIVLFLALFLILLIKMWQIKINRKLKQKEYAIIEHEERIKKKLQIISKIERRRHLKLREEREHLKVLNDTLTNDYCQNRAKLYEQLLIDCNALKNNITQFKQVTHWRDTNLLYSYFDSHFFLLVSKLRQRAKLNDTEIKLCLLVLVGFRVNTIAEILPYAKNSTGKLKDTTAKKLNTTSKNLYTYLINLAIGEEIKVNNKLY